jgi:hypothetical protein
MRHGTGIPGQGKADGLLKLLAALASDRLFQRVYFKRLIHNACLGILVSERWFLKHLFKTAYFNATVW